MRLPEGLRPRLGRLIQHPPRPLRLAPLPRPAAPRGGWPEIGMVTPAFGHAGFIERTLRCLLAQDYPALRLAVMDGGSADGTEEILRHYAPRLHHWQSAPDGGQTQAINAGFAVLPKTELMGWLNSDDLLMPGALRLVGAWFARHPEVDVVYGHRVLLDEYDREIGRWVLPPHDAAVLTWADYVPQETLFWRRRLWDRIGGALDESFRFAMDWDLLLRFQAAGARFHRLPHVLGGFRVHAAQKTSAQLEAVGQAEMTRLRQRAHGRTVDWREINHGIAPYLARHVAWDQATALVAAVRGRRPPDLFGLHGAGGPLLRPLPAPPAAEVAGKPPSPGLRDRLRAQRTAWRRRRSDAWQAGTRPAAGDVLASGAVALEGPGWQPPEHAGGLSFRWVVGPVGFALPAGTAGWARLDLELEAGPSLRPGAALLLEDATGALLARLPLGRRQRHRLDLPVPARGPARFTLRPDAPPGPPGPDGRLLLFRIFTLHPAPEIAAWRCPVWFGPGWHAFEHFGGEHFRWAEPSATLRLAAPARPARLRLLVESGASLPGRAFRLELRDQAGALLGGHKLNRRQWVSFRLPAAAAGVAEYQLLGDQAGMQPAVGDDRSLCFRVLRLEVS